MLSFVQPHPCQSSLADTCKSQVGTESLLLLSRKRTVKLDFGEGRTHVYFRHFLHLKVPLFKTFLAYEK